MVMATPSPQQVGREFVRQYYTVLHEAPDMLHRFYSSGSTFVHGGIDRPGQLAEEPVTGQLDIDKKIKELSFKDCHTKIRQVDSQATIGNGVVVQVTGELSNNGEPMRRFMQTFVLAPQSAKKFYVHNDIFRYQDEVYHDNSDTESEDHQTIQEPALSTTSASKPTGQQANLNYYQQQGDQLADQQTQEASHHHQHLNNHEQENIVPSKIVQEDVVQQQHQPTSESVTRGEQNVLVNGHGGVEQVSGGVSGPETVPPPQPQRAPKEDIKENKNNVELFSVADGQNEPVKTNSVVGSQPTSVAKEEKDGQQDNKSSWAKIIGNNRSTGSNEPSNVLSSSQNLSNHSSQPQTTSSASIKFGSNPKDQKIIQKGSASTSLNQNGSKPGGKPSKSMTVTSSSSSAVGQQVGQPASQQPSQKKTTTQGGQAGETNNLDTNWAALEDEKRFGRYPDGQQVFVGNLNQDLSETELRQLFGQYGKVVEVRINTNSKQQSGRRLPNYGFVVFDDAKTVETLLGSSKSNNILYKSEKGVEYRLNVEEKRARQGRISSGFGGGNVNNGKSNRVTRSSSNGSRNGPNNSHHQTNGTSSSKKSNNTHMNANQNDYINEKKREIYEQQQHSNNSHHMIETSGGHFQKNTSRRS